MPEDLRSLRQAARQTLIDLWAKEGSRCQRAESLDE